MASLFHKMQFINVQVGIDGCVTHFQQFAHILVASASATPFRPVFIATLNTRTCQSQLFRKPIHNIPRHHNKIQSCILRKG